MTTTAATSETLRQLIAEELPDLIAIRRDIHAHPELGYAEDRTSALILEQLKAASVAFQPGLAGGTGVLGHIPGESERSPQEAPQGAVALRADIDALPIEEETGLPYASTIPGRMHACGHDGHTTILIGAARVLAKVASRGALPNPVTFVFQPAEEGGGGGKRMVEDGALDGTVLGPPVSRIFGLHGWPRMKLGRIGSRPGPMLAAADMFEVEIEGVGNHAAFPHGSRDPIVAASALVSNAQSIVGRNVGPLESAVVSFTQIHAGTTHNIIPPSASLMGTVRTLDAQVKERVVSRLRDMIEHTAAAHGCKGVLHYHDGYPVTINDTALVEHFNATAIEAFGGDALEPLADPVMGGEDFSFYGRHVPACFFALGLCPPDLEEMPDLHQPTFDFNDDAISIGVEMFCRLAMSQP